MFDLIKHLWTDPEARAVMIFIAGSLWSDWVRSGRALKAIKRIKFAPRP